MATRKGLGRGLGSLITDRHDPETPHAQGPVHPAQAEQRDSIKHIAVDRISRNPRQPRQTFREEALEELAASIREHGVLQPLMVRTKPDGTYELIAGERRLRASGLAGLQEVPVHIVEVSDLESLEIAIIENLQREDLNPIEEAEGYRELAAEFKLTQEEIARQVGRSRAAVANALRLLTLADDVRECLKNQRISTGHAKALLGLSIPQEQTLLAKRIIAEDLSVRATEKIVKRIASMPSRPRANKPDIPTTHLRVLSEKLHNHFGTSVRLQPCKTFANGKKSKGSIEIDFFSNSDLERVLSIMGVELED
ncbi:MAG: ParB/RepB/Spo0J family partition protein [Kiritimatiellia bacterium]